MASQEAIARAQSVKAKHEHELMRKRNVVGVGVGFQERAGQLDRRGVHRRFGARKAAARPACAARCDPYRVGRRAGGRQGHRRVPCVVMG